VSGTTTLVATVSNSATSKVLSVNTEYTANVSATFSVRAVSPSGEDGNISTATLTTPPDYATLFQNIIAVSAYGAATGAPSGTPTAKQVIITWKAFTNAITSTEYKLYRVNKGDSV